MITDLFGRDVLDGVIEHLDPHLGEPAELLHRAVLSVPEVPDHPDAGVVDLEDEPGVGDGPVFLAHGVGEGPGIVFLALVVQVGLQRLQARRRHDGHEGLARLRPLEARLEAGDVRGDLSLAAIGHLAGADHLERPPLAPAVGHVLVELPKVGAVLAREDLAVERPHLEAGHPRADVVHPGAVIDLANDGFAEFPIVDDVDPGAGLQAHNLADAVPQTALELRPRPCAEAFDQLRRARKAADVGCQYAAGAAVHVCPSR